MLSMNIEMHIFYYPNSFIATVRFMRSDIPKSICTNSLKSTEVDYYGFLSVLWQPTIVITGLKPPANSMNRTTWLHIK